MTDRAQKRAREDLEYGLGVVDTAFQPSGTCPAVPPPVFDDDVGSLVTASTLADSTARLLMMHNASWRLPDFDASNIDVDTTNTVVTVPVTHLQLFRSGKSFEDCMRCILKSSATKQRLIGSSSSKPCDVKVRCARQECCSLCACIHTTHCES